MRKIIILSKFQGIEPPIYSDGCHGDGLRKTDGRYALDRAIRGPHPNNSLQPALLIEFYPLGKYYSQGP